ncbi:hypothetical protein TrST_g10211 [Triparma strigata]|uniref:DNL-type domain-containing protein n=1 Tax=Triparma strigata TaxID=1606541 RepID=A0A9W7ARF4_9STRA|nr:hypothetical protein TrST_g10211 [Triparma strigata]
MAFFLRTSTALSRQCLSRGTAVRSLSYRTFSTTSPPPSPPTTTTTTTTTTTASAAAAAPPPIFPDIPGSQTGGRKLAVVYTCKVCDTRSAKRFTENAYRNGVVMVRCPGCENLHLIADRLGYFEDKGDGGWDIQKFLKEQGGNVNAVTEDGILELTMKDVMGGDGVISSQLDGQLDDFVDNILKEDGEGDSDSDETQTKN